MYLLDTNVFITAAKNYYPFDFCRGFWDFLITKSLDGQMFVAQSVIDEINGGASADDPLKQWVENNVGNLRVVTRDSQVQENLGRILTDIHTRALPNNFSAQNIENFASIADSWIIATALTHGMTVVTNETPAGANSTKIKIPNICNHYNISYATTFTMLRQLGINLCHNRAP